MSDRYRNLPQFIVTMKSRIQLIINSVLILLVAFSCKNESTEIVIPVTKVDLSKSVEVVEVGSVDTLEVLIQPENADDKEIIWNSSETSVATVSQEGIVTGISPGVSIISATTKDNRFTAMDTVQVVRWSYYYMESVPVRPVVVDSLDNVWCGGMKLTKISNNTLTVYPEINHISAIAANGLNNRWFGTYNSGIWNFDGIKWTIYNESNSNLAYNSIVYNSMALDSKDNLWVGTLKTPMGTGVTMYDGSQWHVYNSDSGLVYNNVVNIAIDNQGKKWFTTSKGISSFDDSDWLSYTSENTGIDIIDYVFSVAIDKENNKWFGSHKGALKFDGTNWTVYNTSNSGLKWNLINAIAVDKENNIWFATEFGVSKFDGFNWDNYTSVKDNECKVCRCTSIAIDSQNNKWIGTIYGLIKLED